MADQQMRPASKEQAPDPASNFDRSDPSREAGMGRMDTDKAVPSKTKDDMEGAVTNKQDGARQLNAHDVVNQRNVADPGRDSATSTRGTGTPGVDHGTKDGG